MRRRLNPEDRREEVLRATARVMAAHGYYGTTVPKINKAAGTAQGTFYRYFKSVDDAVLSLIKPALEGIYHQGDAIDFSDIRSGSELIERLTMLYTKMAVTLTANRVIFREISIIDRRHPSTVARYLARYDLRARETIRTVAERVRGKPPYRNFDAGTMSLVLFGMVKGAVRELLFAPKPIDARSWASQLARLEAGGLLRCSELDSGKVASDQEISRRRSHA